MRLEKVVKNKVAPPFKIAEFDIYYGEGVSKNLSLLISVKHNIIDKAGAWYSFGSENRIGQGKETLVSF